MNILLLLMANFVYIMAVDKEANFDLIPHDIICPFCIALIERFQQATQQNSAFKNVLCESISGENRKNYDSCIESFDEITVENLRNSTAEDLCKKQKLCPIDYEKVILMANTGEPDFPSIPVVTNEQLENAEKYDILKNIGNVFTGISEGSNEKNLTLHINLNFRKPELDELAALYNSATSEKSN
uniref:Saposin B-type domain-containing protein n=1 Tax=Onchocerca volvulus TaxID=6282 RepID=A0A2K6VEJ0_ONCVO